MAPTGELHIIEKLCLDPWPIHDDPLRKASGNPLKRMCGERGNKIIMD